MDRQSLLHLFLMNMVLMPLPLERIGRLRTHIARGLRSSLWTAGLTLLACGALTADCRATPPTRPLLAAPRWLLLWNVISNVYHICLSFSFNYEEQTRFLILNSRRIRYKIICIFHYMAFSWCFFHTLRPEDKTFTLSLNETNTILQHLLNTFPFQGNVNIPR
jgi:hypothetical protein